MPWPCFFAVPTGKVEARRRRYSSSDHCSREVDEAAKLEPGWPTHCANSHTPWSRTGVPPKITANPSIGHPQYHGYLRDGVLTSDVEGRTFAGEPGR